MRREGKRGQSNVEGRERRRKLGGQKQNTVKLKENV
jgi:hypothetical protein